MREPLLVPVGQYLGPVHSGPGRPPRHHLVRVGWDTVALADGVEADLWSLSHGRPGLVGLLPSTRGTLDSVAAEAGVLHTEAAVATLLAAGVLAEVWPGTEGAERFAAAHRWHSLLTGLGEGPDGMGVGLLGAPPLRELAPPAFAVWTWAQLFPDLLTAATALARGTDDADPGASLTSQLTSLLTSLHELTCVRAGWVDVVPGAR